MKNYIFEIFTSRNTCITKNENFLFSKSASYSALVKSRYGFGKVIVKNTGAFEEYENGELVSWSYPNGLKTNK